MTPQELKNSILQLAIQGKLVEQRPEEGTAAELVEKILAAKNAKSAKKNLTRSRGARGEKETSALSASPREKIPDDEKPFDIPESWEWVRLGECSTYADKKEKVLPSEIRPDDWSLDLEDIEKDTGRIVEFRSAGDRRITGDKVVFRKGQILYSKLRPYLKKILVAPKDGICTPELVPFSTLGGIEVNYLVIVLKSPHVDFAINSVTYGVKMPRVGTDTMVNLPIPLPPLAEQKRIVAKIEELLPLIDRYEKAWSKLEDFNKRFPVDMQKSLLQMAIQGKLVEQRAEEGTGEELLEKILAAKNAKGAKKNLTRSRGARGEKEISALSASPREEIPDDEKPFDIPESWEWVRLGEIMLDVSTGPFGSMLHKADYCDGGIPLVNPMNIQEGRIVPSDKMRVSATTAERLSSYRLNEGMVVVARRGELGRCASVGKEQEGWLCGTGSFFLNPSKELFVPFVTLIISSPYARQLFAGKAVGTTMANLNHGLLKALPFPLPPLAEQKRIVAKLEEILPLCEQLK